VALANVLQSCRTIRRGFRPSFLVSGLLEFVETLLIYKLQTLSREEIERMFTLGDLRQTRVYQEARQEGEQRGKREIRQRLLTRKFGRVLDSISTKLAQLSLEQLGEIDVSSLEELEHLLG